MRPEPPARYGRSVLERPWGRRPPTLATRMILRNLERRPMRSVVSIIGIAFAVAVLLVGLSFIDVMDLLINQQFEMAMRQDATVSFVEPRSSRAGHEVQHLVGVMDVEGTRSVPVRLRAGTRSRTLAITGLPATPRLSRIVDRRGATLTPPDDGLVLSQMLGRFSAPSGGECATKW